jgi:hypothetical protein
LDKRRHNKMLAPIISLTYQNNGLLPSPFPFSTTVANQQGLPVLIGEPSDHVTIRVYNNYNSVANVAKVQNIQFQTFDSSALTGQSTQPVVQNWLHFKETGFGQNSTPPALYTMYSEQTDTAFGASTSAYIPSWGSDGTTNAVINGEGVCGMIEFDTFVSIPVDVTVTNTTYTFSLALLYEWST